MHASDQAALPEEEDFDLLSTKVSDLVKVLDEDLRGCSIYLVGMMGSGECPLLLRDLTLNLSTHRVLAFDLILVTAQESQQLVKCLPTP